MNTARCRSWGCDFANLARPITTGSPARNPCHRVRLRVRDWSFRLLAARSEIEASTIAREPGRRMAPRNIQVFRPPRLLTKRHRRRRVVPDATRRHPPIREPMRELSFRVLDRTTPVLPPQPGLTERRTRDQVRDGTTTLIAAMDVTTGTVTGTRLPGHPARRVSSVPTQITMHRAIFTGVHGLNRRIRALLDVWNPRAHRSPGRSPTDQTLKRANCRTTCPTDPSDHRLVGVDFVVC